MVKIYELQGTDIVEHTYMFLDVIYYKNFTMYKINDIRIDGYKLYDMKIKYKWL